MAESFTVVYLASLGESSGLTMHGVQDPASMIARLRREAAIRKEEAERILAAGEDDFVFEIRLGSPGPEPGKELLLDAVANRTRIAEIGANAIEQSDMTLRDPHDNDRNYERRALAVLDALVAEGVIRESYEFVPPADAVTKMIADVEAQRNKLNNVVDGLTRIVNMARADGIAGAAPEGR